MIGGAVLGRTFTAFRHRNFRIYWIGATISLTGTWVQGTAQSYLVWELTRSPLATSLPMFFFTLPSMFFSLFGGVLADRVDRRRLLLGTQFMFMLSSALLTLLTWRDLIQVGHIYALAFFNGLVMAFDSPTRQALVPRLVSRRDLTNAIGLNSLVFNASRVIGPPIGGVLYALAGPEAAFLFNTVTYLGILYSLRTLDLPFREEAGNPGGPRSMWGDLREGMAYVRAHPVVRTLLLLVAMIGIFGFSYALLMPVMASQVLGGGPAENGLLLGMAGVGATVGALTVATMGARSGSVLPILRMGALAGVALIAFALSRVMVVSAAILPFVGGSLIGFLASSNATIQARVPDHLRGRIMSLYSLALLGSGPVNSLLAGALADAVGAPGAIAFTGVMILLPIAWIALRGGLALADTPSDGAAPHGPREAVSFPTESIPQPKSPT